MPYTHQTKKVPKPAQIQKQAPLMAPKPGPFQPESVPQPELPSYTPLPADWDASQHPLLRNSTPIAQRQPEPEVNQPNHTGMPDQLKGGLEHLSGLDLSDVRVHRNSSKPHQVQALAYTQGTNIHLGPGQERHLPHEGWHVVQQMQGRVKPTMQMKGVAINDDVGLEKEADVMSKKCEMVGTNQSEIPIGTNLLQKPDKLRTLKTRMDERILQRYVMIDNGESSLAAWLKTHEPIGLSTSRISDITEKYNSTKKYIYGDGTWSDLLTTNKEAVLLKNIYRIFRDSKSQHNYNPMTFDALNVLELNSRLNSLLNNSEDESAIDASPEQMKDNSLDKSSLLERTPETFFQDVSNARLIQQINEKEVQEKIIEKLVLLFETIGPAYSYLSYRYGSTSKTWEFFFETGVLTIFLGILSILKWKWNQCTGLKKNIETFIDWSILLSTVGMNLLDSDLSSNTNPNCEQAITNSTFTEILNMSRVIGASVICEIIPWDNRDTFANIIFSILLTLFLAKVLIFLGKPIKQRCKKVFNSHTEDEDPSPPPQNHRRRNAFSNI